MISEVQHFIAPEAYRNWFEGTFTSRIIYWSYDRSLD